MAPPTLVRARWRVRSWVQNPLDECGTYQKKNKKQKKGLLSHEVCNDTKNNGVYDFMYLARVTLVIHCQVNLLHKNIVYDALLCGLYLFI